MPNSATGIEHHARKRSHREHAETWDSFQRYSLVVSRNIRLPSQDIGNITAAKLVGIVARTAAPVMAQGVGLLQFPAVKAKLPRFSARIVS